MRRFLISLARAYKKLARLKLKLHGRTPSSVAEQRVISGSTWDDFCDTLKAAGANIMRHNATVDERTRAEGYRYLSRLTRGGLEAFVEYADPAAPVLRRMVHETVKMGADNPDNHYFNATISGQLEYRISGKRGTVHFLSFSTQKGGYGAGGGLPLTGFLDSQKLEVANDGTVEIVVSVQKQPGNWLPMEPDSGMLMVRQTFLNQKEETPAELFIEQRGGNPFPAPLTSEAIDHQLMMASNLVAGASFLFSSWVNDFQKRTNTLSLFNEQKSTAAGGDPDIAYYHSYWEIHDDQALVIETTPPPCENWNFQLNNHWMESLDYRYHTIHVNKHTAHYNSDGSVRIVVAHRDPGMPNWLTTTGLPRGTMCFRWIRGETHPTPSINVVPFAELKQYSE